MKVTTESGFTVEISETALNDIELLEAFQGMDNGDIMQVTFVVSKLFPGKKKELYDHLRKEDGTVPITDVAKEVADIIGALKDGKK